VAVGRLAGAPLLVIGGLAVGSESGTPLLAMVGLAVGRELGGWAAGRTCETTSSTPVRLRTGSRV